ncbi:nitroreductase family protein [Campylobacter majalis]|uniref:nitroreductase family protein n=1 Tax=Campylobacter majalis TaxID=2790656 RepID=UPI003D697672
MMLNEAIRKRASVREFNGDMPSDDEISQIIDAAYLAPLTMTSKNSHISVISDKKLLKQLDECGFKKFGKILNVETSLYNAPVLILISGKIIDTPPLGWGVDAEVFNRNLFWTMGSVVQNMHLSAVALGLAACPINTVVIGLHDRPELMKRAGVPDGYLPLCSLAVGKTEYKYSEKKINAENFSISYLKG